MKPAIVVKTATTYTPLQAQRIEQVIRSELERQKDAPFAVLIADAGSDVHIEWLPDSTTAIKVN